MNDSRGAASDNFDGRRFRNAGGQEPKSLGSVVKWLLTHKRTPWPEEIKNPTFLSPPRPGPREATVTFIGHSTFLIQTQSCTLLTDPIFSERASPVSFAGPKRIRKPGIAIDKLPKIDIVLVSHNHYDHMDLKSLTHLERQHKPTFVTSLRNKTFLQKHGLSRVDELDWWQELTPQEGIRIITTPTQHFSGRGLFDRNHTLWAGFWLELAELKIWFAADSAYCPQLMEIGERLGGVDLALIPIGAYSPRWFMRDVHMDPEEAVQTHVAVKSKLSFGMHFGTFPLADEGADEPAAELALSVRRAGLGKDEFTVLGFGESRIISA